MKHGARLLHLQIIYVSSTFNIFNRPDLRRETFSDETARRGYTRRRFLISYGARLLYTVSVLGLGSLFTAKRAHTIGRVNSADDDVPGRFRFGKTR